MTPVYDEHGNQIGVMYHEYPFQRYWSIAEDIYYRRQRIAGGWTEWLEEKK
jgi:hypothetical protein